MINRSCELTILISDPTNCIYYCESEIWMALNIIFTLYTILDMTKNRDFTSVSQLQRSYSSYLDEGNLQFWFYHFVQQEETFHITVEHFTDKQMIGVYDSKTELTDSSDLSNLKDLVD